MRCTASRGAVPTGWNTTCSISRREARLPDKIEWVKVSNVAWRGDGFYYSRYPAPASGDSELSSSNAHHRVFYHRLGTSQDADELVFEDPPNPQRFHILHTTEDERFEILVGG